MTEHFLESCGISYRTNEFVQGRPTLVFVHGLSGSSSAWLSYERMFPESYNLLTFDLRGHGKSRKPRHYEDYELKKSADDLYELFEHLHIETCTLVSHSFGTLVALELLRAHQERVTSTVFLSPTAFLGRTRWSLLVRIVGRGFASFFGLFPFYPVIRGRVDYAPYTNTSDWDPPRVLRDLYATSIRVYLYCLTQAYAKNYDHLWETIRVPTLIMHGKEDSLIPVRHAELLAREIRGSTLVTLEHANHIIVLNNLLEVSKHIKAFAR